MFKLRILIFFYTAFLLYLPLQAQKSRINYSVEYETVYDDPYDINRFYILIQPLYGEAFSTNTNIGFGLEANYYLKDIMDFQIGFRTPYSKGSDLMRDAASKNSDALNTPKRFYYGELGMNYHLVDRLISTKSKFVLYSKNFLKFNRWKTMVPEYVYVPSNLRRILGIRLGGSAYQSAFDVGKVLDKQNMPLENIIPSEDTQLSFYSNINSQGFYIGGSMELIKNIAINFENLYDQTANDLMFTVFVDLLIHPFITIQDIRYQRDSGMSIEYISNEIIDSNLFGFRAGIKGKFNRAIGFGYSVETGIRPGIQGKGFYLMGVFSVPVFGFRLNKEASAFVN